jgi:hypothetical protein
MGDEHRLRKLTDKWFSREYVEKRGIQVSELFAVVFNVDDLPAFEDLPSKFVIKPTFGTWSSRHVYAMARGVNLLDHQRWTREEIIQAMRKDTSLRRKRQRYIVEELIEPEEGLFEEVCPDYKAFAFDQNVVLIGVSYRRSKVDKKRNEHHYILLDGTMLRHPTIKYCPMPEKRQLLPNCWDELLEVSARIGRELDTIMGIDFHAIHRGAIFG